MKKLLSLAALAACVAATALPAAAAPAGTVTIDWNINETASVVFHGNYTIAGADGSLNPTPATVNQAGGSDTCSGGGTNGAGAASSAITLDFGNITPSAKSGVCFVLDAVEGAVTTTDGSGVNEQVEASAALPAGYSVCMIPVSNTKAIAAGTTGIATATNLTAAGAFDNTASDTTMTNWSFGAGGACSNLTNTANATASALNLTTAYQTLEGSSDNNSGSAFYLGSDIGLIVPANAAKIATPPASIVINYQYIFN